MSEERKPIDVPALWRDWCSKQPAPSEVESGVVRPVDIASRYDEATGVKGWKAEVSADGKRIDLTPPTGYVICYGDNGRPQLFRTLHQVGISIRETAK
jgi:hypothetical protein